MSDGPAATLNWRTASETNNSGFDVQRKKNGSFQTVGFVEGAGTTTQPQTYRFRVSELAPGRHTFRLRQVDLDGTAHLSPARSVLVHAQESGLVQTSANPVPSGQTAQFVLTAEQPKSMTVALVDAMGRTVRTVHDGRMTPPRTSISVETASLTSGVYFLHATGDGQAITKKFSIVK